MSGLRLPRAVWSEIRAHGEETYPDECCGVLLGRPSEQGWRVERAVRAANACAGSARTRYSIAPAELVTLVREARRVGLEIAGFYHSHPDHPAQWSATDLVEAHWVGCSYVITAVSDGAATETRSFLLAGATEEDKRFEDEPVVIDEEAAGR